MPAVEDLVGNAQLLGGRPRVGRLLNLGQLRQLRRQAVPDQFVGEIDLKPEPSDRVDQEFLEVFPNRRQAVAFQGANRAVSFSDWD
jgi:hypothetical protein